jgi:DNA polymerase I
MLSTKLILIDGNAILHRAYHALPPLTTRAGEPINAVYGLVSMLLKIVEDLKPTHLAVCFDRKEPTFRKIEFKDYQAHRPETDKELISQFEKARTVLASMNIEKYEKPGYEADDLIGTIATRAAENSKSEFLISEKITNSKFQNSNDLKVDEVVIVTGDKDIMQLVDDQKNIKVYLPVKGLSVAVLMGERQVKEKLGVGPKQIPDYKALVGDPSDNYKGVPGIGPKTAVGLLEKFGNFENVYTNLHEIPQSTREKLIGGRESGELSLKLAKIVRDVEMEFNLENLKKWNIGSPDNIELFEKYGFKTLTGRVKKLGENMIKENQTSLF